MLYKQTGEGILKSPPPPKKTPEAHGPHRSPEKQFQSMNTFAQSNDFAITLRENNHYLLFEDWFIDYLSKLEFPLHKGTSHQVWSKLVQWFCRKWVLNFLNVFSLFHYNLPLEKGMPLHLNKYESYSSKDALCQVWLKLSQWFWGRKFLNFINIFSLFCYYLPLEKSVVLHWCKDTLC